MGTRLEHVIARNVAEQRARKNLTQVALAERMREGGFTWSANRVAQIETLRRPASLLEIIGLARVFGVKVRTLMGGDDSIALPGGAEVPLEVLRSSV